MVITFTDKSIVEVSTHLFPESFDLKGVAKYVFNEIRRFVGRYSYVLS